MKIELTPEYKKAVEFKENIGCANGFWHRVRKTVIKRVFTDVSQSEDNAPMLPSNLDLLTPVQRLIVEQAFVLAEELEATAEAAPQAQVIDRCESLLLGHGRDFLRGTLEVTLQSRVDALEKKAASPEPAPAAMRADTRGKRPRR
jgi:hypothetical protein